jgi:hypothetical protein
MSENRTGRYVPSRKRTLRQLANHNRVSNQEFPVSRSANGDKTPVGERQVALVLRCLCPHDSLTGFAAIEK